MESPSAGRPARARRRTRRSLRRVRFGQPAAAGYHPGRPRLLSTSRSASQEEAMTVRPGAADVTEHDLLVLSEPRLEVLFRAAAAGPAPTGFLDGTAILLPGTPVTRPLAA